jgi:hypothetical protein
MRTNRQWWVIAAAISAILGTFAGTASAQEPKQLHEKHDTTALYRALGDVINLGVKLFNDQSDYAGCYRVFQGSLVSVRPFLTSELQKKIDKGLASAEKQATYADRAFELRAVLDDIRRQLKPGETKVDEKKKEEKKSEEKKVDEKKSDTPNPAKKAEEKKSTDSSKGQLAGKVAFQGQPVTGGYTITLVRGDKRLSSTIQKDGSFQFPTPIAPGEYAIAVEPIRGVAFTGVALPPRYEAEKTSGLTITVQGGKQQVDLNLVK